LKGKTEEVANSGSSMGGKIDGAFGKVGKKIEDSTKGLRSFQGAITGIIGVVGGLTAIGVGAFNKIAGEIREAKESADAFNNSLRNVRSVGQDAVKSISGFGDTGDELSQLKQRVEQQRRAIADETAQAIADAQKKYEEADPLNPFAEKKNRLQLEKDINDALANERRQLQRLNEAATKKEAEVSAKIEKDRLDEQDAKEKEIADRTRELRLSVLDDVGRAEEELAFRQKQIQNEIAEAGGDERRVSTRQRRPPKTKNQTKNPANSPRNFARLRTRCEKPPKPLRTPRRSSTTTTAPSSASISRW